MQFLTPRLALTPLPLPALPPPTLLIDTTQTLQHLQNAKFMPLRE
jgi:hypothetical protein